LHQEGLNWRPKDKDLAQQNPPQPNDPSYRAYYDDLDLARGWATTGVGPDDARYNSDGFVRYPDPRVTGAQAKALHFMAKVEKVVRGDADNTQGDKTGNLRITVIGRSANDMAAFDKLVEYVSGTAQQPLTANMRSITNWDFVTANVPSGKVASPVTNSKTVTLTQVSGRFPVNSHFYITLNTAQNVQFAVVQSYAQRVGKECSPWRATQHSRRSTRRNGRALGAPPYINYDNSASTRYGHGARRFESVECCTPGSVRANAACCGSVKWRAQLCALVKASKRRRLPAICFGQPASNGAVRRRGCGCKSWPGPPHPKPPSASSGENQRAILRWPAPRKLVNEELLANSSADRAFPGNGGAWANMTEILRHNWSMMAGIA
jgi:hypothetical protein